MLQKDQQDRRQLLQHHIFLPFFYPAVNEMLSNLMYGSIESSMTLRSLDKPFDLFSASKTLPATITSFTAYCTCPFFTSLPPLTTPEKSPFTGLTLPENLVNIMPFFISDINVSRLVLPSFITMLVVETEGGEPVEPLAFPVLFTPSFFAVYVLYRNFLSTPFSITTFRRWGTPSLSKLDAPRASVLVASSSTVRRSDATTFPSLLAKWLDFFWTA